MNPIDIIDTPFDRNPPAGAIRLINDAGLLKTLDPNGVLEDVVVKSTIASALSTVTSTVQVRTSTADVTSIEYSLSPPALTGMTDFVIQANSTYVLEVYGIVSTSVFTGSIMPMLNLVTTDIVDTANVAVGSFSVGGGTIQTPFMNDSRRVQLAFARALMNKLVLRCTLMFKSTGVAGIARIGFAQWNGGVSGTSTIFAGAKAILTKYPD